MSVDKLSVSFDQELGRAVRESAERSGRGLSGWLADAADEALRREAFGQFLEQWEAEQGALTDDELDDARQRLTPRPLPTT
jgi:hypothetical protein